MPSPLICTSLEQKPSASPAHFQHSRNSTFCLRNMFRTAARAFSTTSAAQAGSRKQTSSIIRKKNILQKAKRSQEALADRPSVVLGTRPSEELFKWPRCDLAKVLVDEEALFNPPSGVADSSSSSSAAGSGASATGTTATSSGSATLTPYETPLGTLQVPAQPAFGISPVDQELLFNYLPRATAQASASAAQPRPIGSPTASFESPSVKLERAHEVERAKAEAFARVLDLRNANAKGIAFENRRRIVIAFSTPENPFDPGRPEVQGTVSCVLSSIL
jgi:small subunit ribosomal protein S15